ncbi:hypothetical protein HBI65_237330 [Parastagonospora nodorum]|nr:hypothetical protein HBI76_223910 [Parastagonospora nodorum]KAH5297363.1 hypothetical protein HBI12_207980 [Parastagonospora nodorum]KAH5623982.1 hypothetical protein HBI51_240550 [Parastagonospora nodorum]KAH6030070.1 hypothetical protein HBI54_222970 [Parastagonospora nodorum]KAH6075108.1 hypothetical protein HBI65_237330 [Parastagonospora nodorum]
MESHSPCPPHLGSAIATPERSSMSPTATDHVFPIRSLVFHESRTINETGVPSMTEERPPSSHVPIVTSHLPGPDEPVNGPTEYILRWLHEESFGAADDGVTIKLPEDESKAPRSDNHATHIPHGIVNIMSHRCEDEPIHIPGAIQSFGLLVALEHNKDAGALPVRMVSENSREIIAKSPQQLFALTSFTNLFSGDQADIIVDHVDLIKNENDNVELEANGPEVFSLDIDVAQGCSRRLWCAMHKSHANPDLIICEFEVEGDDLYPLVPSQRPTHDDLPDHGGIACQSPKEADKCKNMSDSSAGRIREPSMHVLDVMTQAQERLAAATNLPVLCNALASIVKDLTSFDRVMVYQFDALFNGHVIAELGTPPTGQSHFQGLKFPASDIPKQARELYGKNKVQVLYDRKMQIVKIVCRDTKDLETPLDLTYSHFRAMSPMHLLYLRNMAVRSSMSISINGAIDLWGLIICHSYEPRATRISFPSRKLCRFIGEEASRNIENLHVQSRLHAWSVINKRSMELEMEKCEVPPSRILLDLFKATSGLFWIAKRTKLFGYVERPQEALAISEYFKIHKKASVTASVDIAHDFPQFRYPPGFYSIVGILVVPLSEEGSDFVIFFRDARSQEVLWAGNPHKESVHKDTPGPLQPRSSFEPWSETVTHTCDMWSKEDIEVAKMLCLVSEQLFQLWNGTNEPKPNVHTTQRDSQLTQLLLSNTSHELRTPLNAVINYLEVAKEDMLDPEAQEIVAKSCFACQSFIRTIAELFVPNEG